MRKISQMKKNLFLWLFVTVFLLHALIPKPFYVLAQDSPAVDDEEADDIKDGRSEDAVDEGTDADVDGFIEDEQICLGDSARITVATEGAIVRIYEGANDSYSVPIVLAVDCTVILDNVKNTADLSIANGVSAHIRLKGSNQLGNVLAEGGAATNVFIEGNGHSDILTTNYIACGSASQDYYSSSKTGAVVTIENCAVNCRKLGCGMDAGNKAFISGGSWIANAPRGGSASPNITIRAANLTVSEHIACGGNGVHSSGSTYVQVSDGGTAGAVYIDSSIVNVSGNVAIGGKGGDGAVGYNTITCTAGMTRSSCAVTICNQSEVAVGGNLATQQSLPAYSNGGSQQGLNGVTVTVLDSILSAKDIASGGSGHQRVKETHTPNSYGIYMHDIRGTNGGRGGKIVAKNASVTCETAVCGGVGGEYQYSYQDSNGNICEDTACSNHPVDGNGGEIQADNSVFTISKYAAQKGNRWNAYGRSSVYSDSQFVGGTINGTIYGNVITTDLTSIVGGGFVVADEVRNTQEATCAKCVLRTSEPLAGQCVLVTANELSERVLLDDNGILNTYLAIGLQQIQIEGNHRFYGKIRVRRAEDLNDVSLLAIGSISVASGGAVIRDRSYTYQNEEHAYEGIYTVSGIATQAALSVESGSHVIKLLETSLDTLSVLGNSSVCLELTDQSSIRAINVAPEANLTVSGGGCLKTEVLGNENGLNGSIWLKSGTIQTDRLGGIQGGSDIRISDVGSLSVDRINSPIRNAEGKRMYATNILFETPGEYAVTSDGRTVTAEIGEDKLMHLILEEGESDIQILKDPFCFRGKVMVTDSGCIRQSDLTLYVDCSAGEIVIGEHEVSVGDQTIMTDANVSIAQTGEANPIRVEKTDANIQLESGTDASLAIELPDDFCGTVFDASGVLIAGAAPPSEETDTPTVSQPSDSGDSDVTTGDSTGGNSVDSSADSSGGGSSNDGNSSADSGSSIGSGSGSSGSGYEISSDNQHAGSGNVSGSSSNSSSGGTVLQSDTSHKKVQTVIPTAQTLPAAPALHIQSSLKSLGLIGSAVQNVYNIFTKKKVSLTVARENGTEYYYKVVKKGQKNSAVKWQKLNSDKITVKTANQKQRIVLKAVNAKQCTIQKTPGFMIDTRYPAVDGIKGGKLYKGSRTIRVSDNSGSCSVSLNGKKVSNRFQVKKKGIYLLSASDSAGNKRIVMFAIF